MTPVFDKNGLAAEPGEMRCFYYDSLTGEYTGWSDEYINVGVSVPGCSTAIEPGDKVEGKVFIFSGFGWELTEDHRGEKAYAIEDGQPVTVDYIGALCDGYTFDVPGTKFDKWDNGKWVTDTEAQLAFDISSAASRKQSLIAQANDYMNSKQWPGKAAMGRLKDDEKEQYNLWLDYLELLEDVDTSAAPDINWPVSPKV